MSDTLNQRDALKRRPLAAREEGRGGASFWEVRGTFDLMKMLALQVKCCEAQPSAFTHINTHTQAGRGTHTHTLTRAAAAVAARKRKMLAPGATKKSYE